MYDVPYGYCHCGCGQKTRILTRKEGDRRKGEPNLYLKSHHQSKGWVEEDRGYVTPCWIWQGTITKAGYGRKVVEGACRPAHRIVYELRCGPIPEGLVLDHLCRVRSCVNPAHLEPVTIWENVLRGDPNPAVINLRKTHCLRGHPLEGDHVYVYAKGRKCRICKNENDRRRRAEDRP